MTQSSTTKSITHPAEKGMKTSVIGILVNAVLAAVKGITGIFGNSYALVADAIESSLDVFSSAIVWGGLKISTLPADADHPYGHGKAEPLAGALVSIGLLAGAVIIIIQSVNEIITPHHAPAPFTLIVLVIVILTKEILFRFVIRVGKEVNSTAVKGDAWHHRSDAITSAAAFIGITVALIGGDGYESADDYAALFVSIIIAINAYRIFRPALNEIMDAAPQPEIENRVREIAGNVEGVMWLEKCHVRKMGFDIFVDLHVTVDANITVHEGHEVARRVKASIRQSNQRIIDVLIHIEPSSISEKSVQG
ncbi:MAG: cation transporter [Ignavibacteriae bacterium]|nr:cation transporter [Ignavibacteriota bacterium]